MTLSQLYCRVIYYGYIYILRKVECHILMFLFQPNLNYSISQNQSSKVIILTVAKVLRIKKSHRKSEEKLSSSKRCQ